MAVSSSTLERPRAEVSRSRSAQSTRRVVGDTLAKVGLAGLLVFVLFPIVWFIYASLRHESDIIARSTAFIPDGLTLENYIATWRETDFPRLLLNSFITSTITVFISLTLATIATYSLSRARFRGRAAVQSGYLAVRIIPGVLLLIPIYILIQQIGLLDTTVALAITYTTFTMPAALWFMKGFFDSLPVDLENAARVDGCSRIGAYSGS
jgi:multiple sugar transport system permease protein